MEKKIFPVIVALVLLFSGCDSGDDPPNRKTISIPYHS